MANEAPERETPERILVSGFVWYDINDHHHHLRPNATEYIRADLATLSSDAVAGEKPAYWAVHTSTGVHVGLWPDKATAENVVSEYPNGMLTALYAAPPELDQLRDRVKELEKASREKFYYPIVMPVNSEGHGPADLRDAVKLTWEVWDQELMSHGSFDFLLDAVDLANELNARRVREGGKVDG